MNQRPSVPLLGLCIAEWRKVRGRGLAYAVLLFGLLHGLAGAGAIKGGLALGAKLGGGGDVDPVDWLIGGDLSLYLAAFPVNGLAILLAACILWAEDHSLGTLAMIFVRPVSRAKVFAGKLLVSWGIGALSLALATGTGLLLGIVLLGFSGDVGYLAGSPVVGWAAAPPDVPAMGLSAVTPVAGEAMGTGARMGWMFLRLLAATLVLGPSVALAALVAQVTRSPILTLFGSMFLLLLDGMVWAGSSAWGASNLDGNALASKVAEFTLFGARRGLFGANMDGAIGEMWPGGLLTVLYTAIFAGLALYLFVKRDVT